MQRHLSLPTPAVSFAPTYNDNRSIRGGQTGIGLPLNILALVIDHVDNLADISRLTRTSRLLYYMTLPRLYEHVVLTSHREIRRVEGRVEGLGGGSPLCMALGSLATSQSASVVKNLTLQGFWKENDDWMLGRIPDATVLLSIAIRAAIDKMVALKGFVWHLDTKPLGQIYQGLTARSTLTSFTLRFPISRTPRPITVIPAIPSLRNFSVMDLDPLCYNDDLSTLLFGSRNLEVLHMHWNPRMRLEAESSSSLTTYFGKCISAGYKLGIRKVGMQNFYGPNNGGLRATINTANVTESHFLDMFGGAHGSRTNVFVDETWRVVPTSPEIRIAWKIHRSNELAMQHTRILRGFKGLEELYLVSRSLMSPGSPASSPQMASHHLHASPASSSTSSTSHSSLSSSTVVMPGPDLANLGKEYLDAIMANHGTTLRRFLFFDKFGLDNIQLTELISKCPRLKQLGIALDGKEDTFRRLVASVPNIVALRVLENDLFRQIGVTDERNLGEVCKELGKQVYITNNTKLQWIGLGDKVFKVDRSSSYDGRYSLIEKTWKDVQHLAIWRMDTLELF